MQLGMVCVFILGFVAAGVWSLTDHWRRATFALGATMLWCALLRLTCDSQVIGLLAVRSKRFDIAFSTGLGAAMVWLAWSVDALGS